MDLLGQTRAEFRRSRGAAFDLGSRAGGPRRQSHRPHVHRRSQRRVALSSAAQGRLRESAAIDERGRRARAHRLRHHRRLPLCAPGQQTAARGAARLPGLARRDLRSIADACVCRSRSNRLAGRARFGSTTWLADWPASQIRPRRRNGFCRWPSPARQLPSSQQNTFTGRLTEPMFDAIFTRARALLDEM